MIGPASVRRPAAGNAAFDPRTVLAMLLVGALAFLAALYFIGMGKVGGDEDNGGGHAASSGINGFAALVDLLEASHHTTGLIRNPARLKDPSLLVLTPPQFADAEDINEIVEERRYLGPTLIVLPKWSAMGVPTALKLKAKKGWVFLLGSDSPEWAEKLFSNNRVDVQIGKDSGRWSGMGLSGRFADPGAVQTVSAASLASIVEDSRGQALVSYLDDGGHYPELERSRPENGQAGAGDEDDREVWPVILVAEPDLMNNYGMADRNRAMLALRVIDAALEGSNLPVEFDLTLNGLGSTTNLLTLAFTPPFLAATLCLIVAAIVVGWRAFYRFGPPLADAPQIAPGKRQLALNSANLIQRAQRLYLLGEPYAALVRARFARKLRLKPGSDIARLEAEIDRLMYVRGQPGFLELLAAMRGARGAHEVLRRASALRQMERTLER